MHQLNNDGSSELPIETLHFVAAPLVDVSYLPWRILVARHGATLTHTPMIMAERFLGNLPYREHVTRDLQIGAALGADIPNFLQLGCCKVEQAVQVARHLGNYVDGFDLNMGCPQDPITRRGCGSALLGQRQWAVACDIVANLRQCTSLPVSAKLRLCQTSRQTCELGRLLESAGASHLTLHARFPSSNRRRKGAAFLEEVSELKRSVSVPVLSNGNIRTYDDIQANVDYTGADGVMSGVGLMRNPYLFENILPDTCTVSLEYLDICEEMSDLVPLNHIKKHLVYFHEREDLPKSEGSRMAKVLSTCEDIDHIRQAIENSQSYML